MVLELVVIVGAIVLAVLIARARPSQSRGLLELILAFRTLIVGLFLLAFALVLIFTGIIWMVLLGGLLLFLIVLFVLLVREGGDLRSATEVLRSWI